MAELSGKESNCQCRRREFSPWGQEDPLEEEIATHSSILAWRIHEQESLAGYSPWYLMPMRSHRAGHDWTTNTFTFTELPSGCHYFLQFEPEVWNKELVIWATVSSRACFCSLCRASPSSAAKNIINLISVRTIWWSPCVELSTGLLQWFIGIDTMSKRDRYYL